VEGVRNNTDKTHSQLNVEESEIFNKWESSKINDVEI
jgi:hypothetical protein